MRKIIQRFHVVPYSSQCRPESAPEVLLIGPNESKRPGPLATDRALYVMDSNGDEWVIRAADLLHALER